MDEQLAKMHYFGPWQIPWKATKCLCSDGVRRTAWVSGQADTWFSIPARVKVKGKTVSGYVTGRDFDHPNDLEFHQYLYCKNHNLLPKWR